MRTRNEFWIGAPGYVALSEWAQELLGGIEVMEAA
jgi:hypothetical protein